MSLEAGSLPENPRVSAGRADAPGRLAWRAPHLVRLGAFRETTRGAAGGSMADNMFGGAVGSGMK